MGNRNVAVVAGIKNGKTSLASINPHGSVLTKKVHAARGEIKEKPKATPALMALGEE